MRNLWFSIRVQYNAGRYGARMRDKSASDSQLPIARPHRWLSLALSLVRLPCATVETLTIRAIIAIDMGPRLLCVEVGRVVDLFPFRSQIAIRHSQFSL